MRTEFPGKEMGLEYDLVFLRLALPFGWSTSPGYFQACAGLVTYLRCLRKPMSPIDGRLAFSSHMFVDDAMIVDVDLPDRPGQSARFRGHWCEQVSDTGK